LTLDHVIPRHRGGAHTWENLVAACKACNHRKGSKTLDEARLRLIRAPFEPRSDLYSLFTPYLADERNEAWRTYLFLGRN
ncbi:MAG: HNH endonuclease, partial [Chloroflexi bacterium]|nr:HNH endonuclease [Chloroflexota bacterium]